MRLARYGHQVGVTMGLPSTVVQVVHCTTPGNPFTWAATTASNPAVSLLTSVISAVEGDRTSLP